MGSTRHWITLSNVKGIGPAHLNDIYENLKLHNLSILDIFDLNETEISEEFNLSTEICNSIIAAKKNLDDMEDMFATLLENNVDIIPFYSEKYPKLIKKRLKNQIPPFLYTIGNQNLFKKSGVAMLGESTISDRGVKIAYLASKELCQNNITVISGLAKGTGETAHRSAIENGGDTIAFLPYGINHLKIPKILEESYDPVRFLLVSPFFPTDEANKFNGYMRNRIITAHSKAVYIVESTENGGIYEAAKSSHKIDTPLYTTEYKEYNESSLGNKSILKNLNGKPIRGRMIDNLLSPNIDELIARVKLDTTYH